VEANERLGFAPDLRNYGIGAQILLDLGLARSGRSRTIRARWSASRATGSTSTSACPIVQPENVENAGYMGTKRDKLGHLLAS
jgi:3,4-dihydroxy 2-butanone 4-phosphate synthase/GTP cyclohydrolase II